DKLGGLIGLAPVQGERPSLASRGGSPSLSQTGRPSVFSAEPTGLEPNRRRQDRMKPRLDFYSPAPDAIAAVRALNSYVHECGLELSLLELVKTRASQINGCAYCIHMHTRDARDAGES